MNVMADAILHASDVAKGVTLKVKVKGLRVMGLRWLVAAKLFALAGWISGCDLELSTD